MPNYECDQQSFHYLVGAFFYDIRIYKFWLRELSSASVRPRSTGRASAVNATGRGVLDCLLGQATQELKAENTFYS